MIPLEAGQQITVHELLTGALLPSSNECALSLAETIDGSEESGFVQRMNQKALELGLRRPSLQQPWSARLHERPCAGKAPEPHECGGYVSDGVLSLTVYPQIKEITSQQEATLPSLNLEVRNSNPLLRNMPQVTGLKTGTTNKSGACLVTSLCRGRRGDNA